MRGRSGGRPATCANAGFAKISDRLNLAFFFGEQIELNPISRWPAVEHLS
jgi:hypothetical protein